MTPSATSAVSLYARTRIMSEEVLLQEHLEVLRHVGLTAAGPFDQIADAHRHMAANANAGKIMVDIG